MNQKYLLLRKFRHVIKRHGRKVGLIPGTQVPHYSLGFRDRQDPMISRIPQDPLGTQDLRSPGKSLLPFELQDLNIPNLKLMHIKLTHINEKPPP